MTDDRAMPPIDPHSTDPMWSDAEVGPTARRLERYTADTQVRPADDLAARVHARIAQEPRVEVRAAPVSIAARSGRRGSSQGRPSSLAAVLAIVALSIVVLGLAAFTLMRDGGSLQGPGGAPSASPSVGPSGSPGASPSAGPSGSPGASPSIAASGSPTAPTTTPKGSDGSARRHPQPRAGVARVRAPREGTSGRASVAGRDAPTQRPTSEPATQVTLEPTADPTVEPTPEPTSAPTAEQTLEPTADPTVEPTPEPTAEPTPEPTLEPTAEPTSDSTPEPTAEPTSDSTPEPTPEPTAEPTREPRRTPRPTRVPREHDDDRTPAPDRTDPPAPDPAETSAPASPSIAG